jgi:hypothetical protein
MTITAKDVLGHIRDKLAECDEMIALGVARPGTLEKAESYRRLLALFAARKRKPTDYRSRIEKLASGERGRDWGSA